MQIHRSIKSSVCRRIKIENNHFLWHLIQHYQISMTQKILSMKIFLRHQSFRNRCKLVHFSYCESYKQHVQQMVEGWINTPPHRANMFVIWVNLESDFFIMVLFGMKLLFLSYVKKKNVMKFVELILSRKHLWAINVSIKMCYPEFSHIPSVRCQKCEYFTSVMIWLLKKLFFSVWSWFSLKIYLPCCIKVLKIITLSIWLLNSSFSLKKMKVSWMNDFIWGF
jgi:hypothetical protein